MRLRIDNYDDKALSEQFPPFCGVLKDRGIGYLMGERLDVILLCGGRGTRFLPVTYGKIPKPLYKLNGVELIKYSLDAIDFSLVNKLIFAVDYHAEDLKEWISLHDFPCEVVISTQERHGVLNAVRSAMCFVETKSFIVCNTDEVREGLRMRDLIENHSKQTIYLATLSTTYSARLQHRRVINSDSEGRIQSTEYRNAIYREQPDKFKEVNAGFALFDLAAVEYFDETYGRDWDGMIGPLIARGLARAYVMPEVVYFNVGTDEELDMARKYFIEKKEKIGVM